MITPYPESRLALQIALLAADKEQKPEPEKSNAVVRSSPLEWAAEDKSPLESSSDSPAGPCARCLSWE